MRPSLVIFDCDGVLVDSEPIQNRVLAGALTAAGLPMSAEEATAEFAGLPAVSAVAKAERMLGRALPAGFMDTVDERAAMIFRDELKPIPGVADIVRRVKAADIGYCVASSGSREKMALALGVTGLLTFFEGRIFTGLEVERGKPAPDLFLHAASVSSVSPGDCLVIEDSIFGVQAGRAAGMRVLAYVPEGPARAHTDAGGQPFRRMTDLAALIGLEAGG